MNGVSIGVGIIAGVGAFLLAFPGGMAWPRLIVALVMTCVAGILGGTLGPIIHRAVTTADHAVGNTMAKWIGTAVFGLTGIIVVGYLVIMVVRNVIDKWTLLTAAGAPAVVTLIPGSAGSIAIAVVGFAPTIVGAIIAYVF